MTYSPPVYPTSIPSHATDGDDLAPYYDDLTSWTAARANALRLELCAALEALGTMPQGDFTTLHDRLDAIGSSCNLELLTDYSLTLDSDTLCLFSYTNSTQYPIDTAFHSMTDYPTRITVSQTGVYSLFWNIYAWKPGDESFAAANIIINKNGSNILTHPCDPAEFKNITRSTSLVLPLVADDYIEVGINTEGTEHGVFAKNSSRFSLVRFS